MKKTRSIVFKVLLVGILATTALAFRSSTQSVTVMRGIFHLDTQARWETVNLEPGTYALTVTSADGSYLVSLQQGKRSVGFIVARAFSSDDAQVQNAALICVHDDAVCSVETLTMPQVGTFSFASPSAKHDHAAENATLTERVPVFLAEK